MSRTATASSTSTPSRTPSNTSIYTATFTATPSQTSTATLTATLTSTATVTPTLTATPSSTPSATSTHTNIFTATGTSSATPTATASPTALPTSVPPTATPEDEGGVPEINKCYPVPNPGPKEIWVHLSCRAERLQGRIYSQALTRCQDFEARGLRKGWNRLPLASLKLKPVAAGTYMVKLTAYGGGGQSRPKIMKVIWLK
jgi:hypothetical protein